jgi:carbon monoxide dehydrogenase subunit G
LYDSNETTFDVAVELPAGQIAGDLRLSAHLSLARSTGEQRGRVASMHGARISSSGTFTLQLEGDSGRFPTEAVAFSELFLGNAPWTVDVSFSELSDSFLGGIRLLINSEHPVGRLALDPKGESRVKGLLHAEVMRLLIAQVAAQTEEADESSFEEGSIGQVLDSMFEEALGSGLKAIARLYRDEPKRFELLLHDCLDPLAGVIA